MRVGLCVILAITMHAVLVAQPTLPNPERFAGRWEAPDGYGGEVGMNITLLTTVPSSATNLLAIPQALVEFEIGLYQQSNSDTEPPDFNFFATSPNGAATWDGKHLRIHAEPRASQPQVTVDLAWQEKSQTWTGTFERAAFRNQAITLRRPINKKPNPFVGTWYESNGLGDNCLHIAQDQNGSPTGWSDAIRVPGRERYANGLHPPARTLENYGEIAKIHLAGTTHIEAELWAYTAVCCSHLLVATISNDGNSLTGPAQLKQPPRWVRVRGDSCRAAASLERK